ncbi:MAG TPA: hypothetical protein VGR43_06045 [Dehalococcoidia bacterium]|jgi:hypothetical protein|nr:hypothetical protein [Dehalococcoidia bacterium]
MTTEMWLIAAFRVAGALPVLRWPLAGAFIALFLDLGDLFLRDWIDLGGVNDYQRFDKWLDQAYMLTFLAVALRWQAVPRNIAVALYAFRLAGFAAFEITGERGLLIFFPNVFEYWFIFIAALKTFGWEEPGTGCKEPTMPASDLRPPTSDLLPLTADLSPRSWPLIGPAVRFAIPYRYSRSQLAVAATVVIAAKLFHEYTLHVGQWFEGFTATEALQAIWRFFTPPY